MKQSTFQKLLFFCLSGPLCISPAMAADLYATQDYLTGDWGGYRSKMFDSGVDIALSYTPEPAASVSGGYDQTNTYLHNINAALTLDLEKIFSIKKTVFIAKYSSRSGDNLSELYVAPGAAENGKYEYGEYFNKSQEAFGGQTTKLVNFQISTEVSDEWSLDFGRLVMNDLFLRSDLYCNFINNAVCGSPKGVFTPYALNAYPDATVGAHVKYQATDMFDLKLGIFDGSWTRQDSNGWDWSMGRNGVAVIGEMQLFFDRAASGGAQQVVKLGANYNSGDFNNFKTGETTSGSYSVYLLSDWKLFAEENDINQGLALFGSIVANSDEEIAGLPMSYTLGFVYEGLIPTRNRDKLGLMVTIAEHSEYNTYTHDYIPGKIRGTETLLELTYNFRLGYGIEVMPSFQYISNPNGSKDFDNVTVLGTKLNVNF